MPRSIYISPSIPVLKSRPPSGDRWIHEIKFDGWRAQLHKRGERVVIFSRNGHDFTHRFPEIRDSVRCLATRTAILDAEIIACDHQGLPDFRALMSGVKPGLCAWCFDLMALEGSDLRSRPLLERKSICAICSPRPTTSGCSTQRSSTTPISYLRLPRARVSKASCQSSPISRIAPARTPGWIKVKTATWREANQDRWPMCSV